MWATNILFSFSTLSSQTSSSSCCDAVGSGYGWRGSSSSGACHLLRNHIAPLCRSRRDWPTLTVERYFTPVPLSLCSGTYRTVRCCVFHSIIVSHLMGPAVRHFHDPHPHCRLAFETVYLQLHCCPVPDLCWREIRCQSLPADVWMKLATCL